TAAKQIESALASRGVQADSVKQLIDDSVAQDRAFNRMFQAFMALGLFVGIISLGVIAFRSVVERRQQIGMLRAIGFQSGGVARRPPLRVSRSQPGHMANRLRGSAAKPQWNAAAAEGRCYAGGQGRVLPSAATPAHFRWSAGPLGRHGLLRTPRIP